MKTISLTGVIIKEKDLNESDKIIVILTDTKGIISAIAKKSKTFKNRLGGMVQLFAYGEFVLYCAKNGYLLNEFKTKELFLELRNSLEALSLAQYFCEILLQLKPEYTVSNEILRIFLNSLYFIINKKIKPKIIKSIFEFRIVSLCGYIPKLVSCDICGKYDEEEMYFSIERSNIFCSNCIKNKTNFIFLSKSLLYTLRHIIYCNIDNLFKFSISENTEKVLAKITEKYILFHVSDKFKSLDFYKKISS